jgi:hypothetical protein
MNAVTKISAAKLQKLEVVINAGVAAYHSAGIALRKIRDEKLYEELYFTFEEYCQERWGWQRAHAYRLIDSAQVAENLMSPIGDKTSETTLTVPANEGQARELAKLETPDLQRAAFGVANVISEQNKSGKVTAKDVRKAVDLVHEVITENPNIKQEEIAAKAVEKGAVEEVEKFDHEAHREAERDDLISTLIAENQNLKDQIAVGNLPKPEQTAGEIITDLRSQVKTLEATLSAVTSSRDAFQRENAEMMKQMARQRREIEKLKAGK